MTVDIKCPICRGTLLDIAKRKANPTAPLLSCLCPRCVDHDALRRAGIQAKGRHLRLVKPSS